MPTGIIFLVMVDFLSIVQVLYTVPYRQCRSEVLNAVDNYAILCLDIVWCYLQLKSIRDLPNAGKVDINFWLKTQGVNSRVYNTVYVQFQNVTKL